MVIGAAIKFVGITDWFQTTAFSGWLDSWWTALPSSAKMASLGFMILAAVLKWPALRFQRLLQNGLKVRKWPSPWVLRWLSPVWRIRRNVACPDHCCPLQRFGTCSRCILLSTSVCRSYLLPGIHRNGSQTDNQLIEAGIKEDKSSEDEFRVKDLARSFQARCLDCGSALRTLL